MGDIPFDAGGLLEFCSSQADAMLAQFRNINQLLSPTKDWKAPGTLCAIAVLEEKRLDGLIQTPPIRIVVIELLVTPKRRSAGVARFGQRFSDSLEAFV